jgi:hypothetical protein
MKFGNWNVGTDYIEYSGEAFQRFSIPVKELLERVEVADAGDGLYKWIVLATEEDSLSVDELYDLNFAIVYAAGRAGLDLDYSVFDRTVEYQFSVLDDEDDDQDGGEPFGTLNSEDAEAEQKRKEALSERD